MKMKKNKGIKLALISVLLSSVMLIYGTYAWFTYFSNVDSTMTGHVIDWNVDFNGSTNIENEYEIIINNIYPGMEDYKNEFNITNSGESSAKLSLNVKSITIFDETYRVGDELEGVALTNDNFFEELNKKYSFKFDSHVSKGIIHTDEVSVFSFALEWPFETYIKLSDESVYDGDQEYFKVDGENYVETKVSSENYDSLKNELYVLNDAKDTYWGSKAYEFKNAHPDTPSIRLEILVNAVQYIE